MFTGIIQGITKLLAIRNGSLELEVPAVPSQEPWTIGESLAVDGCCLTISAVGDSLSFDLSPETLSRTTFGRRAPGALLNWERALRPIDRMGGHFVQGHVDAIGELVSIEPEASGHTVTVRVPDEFHTLIVDKGNIALDGISLTPIRPDGPTFRVAVIPHTWHNTNLSSRRPGDFVNLEFDILAKYVAQHLRHIAGGDAAKAAE
jgi:riboflavin synthase